MKWAIKGNSTNVRWFTWLLAPCSGVYGYVAWFLDSFQKQWFNPPIWQIYCRHQEGNITRTLPDIPTEMLFHLLPSHAPINTTSRIPPVYFKWLHRPIWTTWHVLRSSTYPPLHLYQPSRGLQDTVMSIPESHLSDSPPHPTRKLDLGGHTKELLKCSQIPWHALRRRYSDLTPAPYRCQGKLEPFPIRCQELQAMPTLKTAACAPAHSPTCAPPQE